MSLHQNDAAPGELPIAQDEIAGDAAIESQVDRILTLVRERTSVDFSLYRRRTIARRVHTRMLTLGIQRPADYVRFIEAQPDEASHLLERLTVKVTRFYRNAESWHFLLAELASELARLASTSEAKVWSAGCATGEEAWTLAMMLARAGLRGSVLGTDVDASALRVASAAVYPDEALLELPPVWRSTYLIARQTARASAQVHIEKVAPVRWAVDDITRDQVSHGPMHLVCCRNVLIYMQRTLQLKVLSRCVDHLVPGGLLWLGEAEWPLQELSPRLELISKKHRFFRKRDTT